MPAALPLPPGSTIGILGGGQLGRMTALAAARLGYRCIVYAPDEDPIAAQVCAGHVQGAYDDVGTLARFGFVHDLTCPFSFSIRITSSIRRSRKAQVASAPGERSFSQ